MRHLTALAGGGLVLAAMALAAVALRDVYHWWDCWVGVSRASCVTVAFLKSLPVIAVYVLGFFAGLYGILLLGDWDTYGKRNQEDLDK